MKKKFLIVIVGAIFGLTVLFFVWSYNSFFVHRGCIDELLKSVPEEEKQLPPKVAEIFEKSRVMEKDFGKAHVIFSLCGDREDLSITEIRFYEFAWRAFLHLYLTYDERLSLYTHLMVFKDGIGLSYGAKHFFSKNVDSLTEEEVIRLILIARSASVYRNGKDEDQLKLGVIEFKKQLENNQ